MRIARTRSFIRRVSAPERIAKIRVPVLLLQAERDVFVKNAAQDAFASHAATCTLEKQPGMRHELYFSEGESLRAYWERIFRFYGN